jgi:hypothetical protein
MKTQPVGIGHGRSHARRTLMVLLLVAVWGALGCPIKHEKSEAAPDCQPEKLAAGAVGSWEAPVKCGGPQGEIAYLQRLRGPDNRPVRFIRSGSMGKGANGNIVDRYVVQSADGKLCREVIMDMYYPGYVENQAVPGFYLADMTF